MFVPRRKTRQIRVGNVPIGGGAPIPVQSMTKTDTRDWRATLAQVIAVAEAGGDIIRITVPDQEAADALPKILAEAPIPVIADIHFDYRMAIEAAKAGVQGLRLNPGNIGNTKRVAEVVAIASDLGLPIRIGVNAGSLERPFAKRMEAGEITRPQAMVESALFHIGTLEEHDFRDIKISLKASDVMTTVAAYQLLATKCDYPFHVGITEAGTQRQGTIKSAVGIGHLALEGLCDTIRVSLCTEPPEEIYVGQQILQSIGLKQSVGDVVACPTCGRLEIDMLPITDVVEERLAKHQVPITVAIMGCAVNGPGEAKGAHIGIAAGRNQGALYRDGELVQKLTEAEIVPTLLAEIDAWAADYKAKHPAGGGAGTLVAGGRARRVEAAPLVESGADT